MVYLVLIYALVYALGEFVSGRIGLPHSVTFAGLAVFLAAALILYRRRYGLGACRRGRKRWPGLLLLLLWAGRRSGAGRLRPQRRRGRVFRLRAVRRVRHGGGAGLPRLSLGAYAAAPAADGGRLNAALFGVFHAVNLIGGAPGAVGIQAVCAVCTGFALCRDGRLLPLRRAGTGHPCAHQPLRRPFPRR